MLAIRLPQDIENRLEELDRGTGHTKTFYAKDAILENLADPEDLYFAQTRLLALQRGKGKTIAINDLIKRYGLED